MRRSKFPEEQTACIDAAMDKWHGKEVNSVRRERNFAAHESCRRGADSLRYQENGQQSAHQNCRCPKNAPDRLGHRAGPFGGRRHQFTRHAW
jgi:hypothetical protein